MDVPHVVSWQIQGTKECNGLLDPYRWAPPERALDPAWRQALTTYRTG